MCLSIGTFNVGLGFLRKLPSILSRCVVLSLDLIALQEIGDPALFNTKLSHYHLVYSAGPSHHEAGVGLLVSHELVPCCRSFRRSKSGRLVAAQLELSKNHSVLVVSAYMPSGIDHRSALDPSTQLAHQLYAEMLSWCVGVKQVIVLGDLNETLTPLDRHPPRAPPPATAASSPIRCLQQEGFTDVYRQLHPGAAHQPGFTHAIDSRTHSVRSRIDYIWTRGFSAPSLLHASIDAKLAALSHHRLLWAQLQFLGAAPPSSTTSQLRLRLPNLRNVKEETKQELGLHLDRSLQAHEERLCSVGGRDGAAARLQRLANLKIFKIHSPRGRRVRRHGEFPSRLGPGKCGDRPRVASGFEFRRCYENCQQSSIG